MARPAMKLPTVDRRRFLRGVGAVLPLPFLPSLTHRAFAAAVAAPPKRMVFLGFGFGTHAETWEPDITQTGKNYTLSPGLEPLARHKADFTVVQGLSSPVNTDPHAGTVSWLTAVNNDLALRFRSDALQRFHGGHRLEIGRG